MSAYWSGTEWKEFTDASSLDYEDEEWILPNRAEQKLQAERSWGIKSSRAKNRGYGR